MFTAILGDMGSGKTNLMTRYLYHASLSGQKVITNYKVNFRHILMPFSEMAQLGPEIQDAVIGADEFGVGADSYDFLSKDVRGITTLATQLRKRNCRLYYTAQRYSMIARRIRIQTNMFIVMMDMDAGIMTDKNGKQVVNHKQICAGRFLATRYNEYLEQAGDPMVFNGRPYWGKYDTNEIIWTEKNTPKVKPGNSLSAVS